MELFYNIGKGDNIMKFYDIDALNKQCGFDNKYQITALVAARARYLSEHKMNIDALPINEKYLSAALLEIENGDLPQDWLKNLEEQALTTVNDKEA